MKTLNRILIVEDNPDDEALLMRQLKKADMDKHVMIIRDGHEAAEYLTGDEFNLDACKAVFLDLDLPRVSGMQLIELIRRNERTSELPVVVMTSTTSPEALEKCRMLGVSCYVPKPLTFSSFAKAFADTFHANRKPHYESVPIVRHSFAERAGEP
jgi:two-component system, response regulator